MLRRNRFLATFAGLSLFHPVGIRAQAINACDLNADGKVNILDVQLATNMAIGLAPCTANVTSPAVCDTNVVNRIVAAALGGSCVTGLRAHSVELSWTASASSNVVGYNVYRGTQSGGPYTTKLTTSPVAATSYTDLAVTAGQTYYYVATSVDSSNSESTYSNQAAAIIPSP